MIHTDVWGSSKIKNITWIRWFVSYVDDHTRISWIFLMKKNQKWVKFSKKFIT